MKCPVYIARCRQCGNTRRTYNDPRLRRSVIECKAACFESHYEWDFVEECKMDDEEEEERKKKEAMKGDGVTSENLSPTGAPPAVEETTSSKRKRKGFRNCIVA
ncbi:uncharacterized protein TM35_000092200 [Trypanosoma theileri]|uniref:Uncharacterized protein n=1 Tax=Trypanosoma theileri TaxID=67003 RepID=A0A1X0P175_9TRYP|nr:uncharacterized protein TM35_000092200 [Trypanosoma theileri]ORC90170.1 hypothetical protein TM35_000092200 [Trypanosoma theileri]